MSYAASSYNDAVQLYNQRKFDQATTIFEQVIKAEVNNANAYYYLGLCYMQSRRIAEAKSIFSKIISQFPETTASTYAKTALQGLQVKGSAEKVGNLSKTSINTQSLPPRVSNENLPFQFVVPYTMVGPKYMVEAKVDGHELQMCVDSGCDRVIIPIEYCDQIGLQRPSGEYNGHYGGTGTGLWHSQVSLAVGPLSRQKIAVDIFDTSWSGVPILGNNFFKGFSRSFDTYAATLRLVRTSNGVAESQRVLSAVAMGSGECTLPFEPDKYRHSPILNITINGHPTKVMFDSGGNDSIWITYEEASALGIDPDNGTVTHVGSTKIPCVMLTVDKVQIGSISLSDVKTMIFDKSQATWGTDIVCFGTALLGTYEYDYVIDDQAKVIRIRKK